MTVTRGEAERDNGEEKGNGFRNIYKGHMDKTKGEQDQWWEVEMARMGRSGGGQMETTVLEQQ